jgi:hypothetical protein
MKRRVFLIVVSVIFIALIGWFMNNPPSLVDAITGATPKSKAKAAEAEPQGYVLAINEELAALPAIKRALEGEPHTGSVTVRLSVTDDSFTAHRAEELAQRLKRSGVAAEVRAYSEMMLFSRAVAGKYELLLYPMEAGAPEIPGAELVAIPGGEAADL